jgi:hypothetical protein
MVEAPVLRHQPHAREVQHLPQRLLARLGRDGRIDARDGLPQSPHQDHLAIARPLSRSVLDV